MTAHFTLSVVMSRITAFIVLIVPLPANIAVSPRPSPFQG